MSNSTVDLFDKILKIEDDKGLFSIKLAGENIWEYIRVSFIAMLLEDITGISTVNKGEGKVEYRGGEFSLIEDEFERKIFDLEKKDLLIVDHPRRVRDGKSYRCVITDELVEHLDYSYYVLEDAYKGRHFLPHRTKNLKYRDMDGVKRYYDYEKKFTEAEVSVIVDQIVEAFECGLSINFKSELKNNLYIILKNTTEEIFYGKKYARILLKLISPKAVIVTVWYSLLNQTLIAEAKKLGIPTIDLQHGRVGKTHVAYNYLRKREISCFPDYLFVYGEYEKNTPNYPIDSQYIIKCGNPELERHCKMNKGSSQREKTITFISNPTDGRIIVQYALYLLDYIRKNNIDCHVVYKLHPSEYTTWEREYPKLINADVELVSDNNHDIYYYLNRSDYIVSITSTTIYEALLFDADIIILQEQDYVKAEPVYANGYAILVKGLENFVNYIFGKTGGKLEKKADFYYERNAIGNMKKAIDMCVNERETNALFQFDTESTPDKIKEKDLRNFILPKKMKSENEEQEKWFASFLLMSVWFDKKQQKKNIADYLVDKGFLSISIYGLGAVGRLLYNELEDSPIEVKYGIDQERPYFFDNNRAFKPGEILEKVDAVIVTPVYYYPEIKETLKKMRCPILSLKDVVDSM